MIQPRYFSRELSWLAFNGRVLEEALDPQNPALERLRFLVIFSTNLNEFFMVRLASLFRKAADAVDSDGQSVSELRARIREVVLEQKERQTVAFYEICEELSKNGLKIELGPSALAEEIFEERVLPELLPLRIGPDAPLPPIKGSRLYMLAHSSKSRLLIEIPPAIGRLQIVKSRHVFLVDRLVSSYRKKLLSSSEIKEVITFKITRDAEIELDDDADDPVLDIEEAIRDREQGTVVRLEVDADQSSETVRWLQGQLGVEDSRVYRFSLPLNLRDLMPLTNIKRLRKLRYNYPEPRRPEALPAGLPPLKFFRALSNKDILLHHPFVSFEPVIELVRNAASDPKVRRICQTLYRTSGESPLLEALKLAAQSGKKVTVLVELKARFDEANNIRAARSLERAGVRVILGGTDLKVHAKLTYVERDEARGPKGYVHLSTGNYHPKTAKLYTDLGLLTSNPAFVADAKTLFDRFENIDQEEDFDLLLDPARFSDAFKTWVVAPTALHLRVLGWIRRETENCRAGLPSGIRAKMNGLVDHGVIDALYEASNAGVPIELLVRGMCCLRPGVPGLSENIRVLSVVDKYLEHSRVFIFENGGEREAWLSSADWMPRNFFRRIELAVPVPNASMRDWLSTEFWNAYRDDNQRARECDQNGNYRKVSRPGDAHRAQVFFEETAQPDFARKKDTPDKPKTPA